MWWGKAPSCVGRPHRWENRLLWGGCSPEEQAPCLLVAWTPGKARGQEFCIPKESPTTSHPGSLGQSCDLNCRVLGSRPVTSDKLAPSSSDQCGLSLPRSHGDPGTGVATRLTRDQWSRLDVKVRQPPLTLDCVRLWVWGHVSEGAPGEMLNFL